MIKTKVKEEVLKKSRQKENAYVENNINGDCFPMRYNGSPTNMEIF